MFEIITRHFWVACILVTGINAAMLKARSARHIETNPELAASYATLIRGAVIWMNIPWIVMGIGSTIGRVPSVFHYFRPQDGNSYVVAWLASVVLLWIVGTHWVFFRGGAEVLVTHSAVFGTSIPNPATVKGLWILCLVGGVLGVIMMWTRDVPLLLTR